MWNVDDIRLARVELDFSTSGQGRHSATTVMAGGVRLFNALEFVDVDPAATQVEICESCGIPHCSSGGWVAFRRLGQRVVWLPAWEEIDSGAWEASEYRPPVFLDTKGAPIFSPACWERLRALHGRLPPCQELQRISSRETARLFQLDAPGHVLGDYPSAPRVRRDLVVAVTNGDVATEVSAVDQCVQDHFDALKPMDLVSENVVFEPIEFCLDLPGTPAWKSFAHLGDRVCFLFDDHTALGPLDGLANRDG